MVGGALLCIKHISAMIKVQFKGDGYASISRVSGFSTKLVDTVKLWHYCQDSLVPLILMFTDFLPLK